MMASVGMTLPFAGRLCLIDNGKYDLTKCAMVAAHVTLTEAGWFEGMVAAGAEAPIDLEWCTEGAKKPDDSDSQYEACVALSPGAITPGDGKFQGEMPVGTHISLTAVSGHGRTGTWCPKAAVDAGDNSKCVTVSVGTGSPTTEEGYFEVMVIKGATLPGGMFCAKKTGGTGGAGGDNGHSFCGAGTEWKGSTCQATADGMMAACKKVSSRGYKRRSEP